LAIIFWSAAAITVEYAAARFAIVVVGVRVAIAGEAPALDVAVVFRVAVYTVLITVDLVDVIGVSIIACIKNLADSGSIFVEEQLPPLLLRCSPHCFEAERVLKSLVLVVHGSINSCDHPIFRLLGPELRGELQLLIHIFLGLLLLLNIARTPLRRLLAASVSFFRNCIFTDRADELSHYLSGRLIDTVASHHEEGFV